MSTYILSLGYSCELAQEAFTGMSTKLGLNHRGFSIKKPFEDTWNSTLRLAINDVPYRKLQYRNARSVGCATFLRTTLKGSHYLTLKCRFDVCRKPRCSSSTGVGSESLDECYH
ncbi:hypothetical protein TELCIR_01921 [Teladorsagia circumcincta]|uniref:Uncharacterized protein n=1 Tax=Teladorsagia circumcincta TaxID=45464 RepID=A0A2G9V0L0_TELCI|nr:hypothetical protein TELCIR_01921 [Teladorsagia circumcincta]